MTQENQSQQGGSYTQLPDKETISQMSDSEFSSLQESINTQLSSSSETQGSSSQQQNK